MRGAGTIFAALLLGFATGAALAHPAPNSFVNLDFGAGEVRAEFMLPVSELAYAMDTEPTAQSLPAYLLAHVKAATPQGRAWKLRIEAVRTRTYLEVAYLVAQITLAPPAGANTRDFVLSDDAVTHEVRNHRVLVIARQDTQVGNAAPELLGALQYPLRELVVQRPVSASRRRPAPAPAAG